MLQSCLKNPFYYKSYDRKSFFDITQIDDENQEIIISLDQIHIWRDDRIVLDEEHHFWNNKTNIINLNGKFIEDCLWTPNLETKNLNKMFAVKPTPTSSNGSPFKTVLSKSGTIQVESRNIQISVPCQMRFSDYPFDQQVRS